MENNIPVELLYNNNLSYETLTGNVALYSVAYYNKANGPPPIYIQVRKSRMRERGDRPLDFIDPSLEGTKGNGGSCQIEMHSMKKKKNFWVPLPHTWLS